MADPRVPVRERTEHYALPAHLPQSHGQDRIYDFHSSAVGYARNKAEVGWRNWDGQGHILEVFDRMSIKGTDLPHLPELVGWTLAADTDEPTLAGMSPQ